MPKKPKCVMILSEGPSDREALTGFFTDLYSMIDEDIKVMFPVLSEEKVNNEGNIEVNYNGDITSRCGIDKDNILPMILKLFIHPELKKHPAFEYPSSVCEVIHLVDIDGVYLDDNRIITGEKQDIDRPYYDVENNIIIAKERSNVIDRNHRKRENLAKLINTKRLRITIEKGANESREKPYSVFFFSKDLDHVLYGKANNAKYRKVDDAREFARNYSSDPLLMAKYFLEHQHAAPTEKYIDSWRWLMDDHDSLIPRTNINILVSKLLSRAGVKV